MGVRKIKHVTDYSPIAGIYFREKFSTIVQVGELEHSELRVLDSGCGHGVLKKMNPQIDITGYDIVRELTEVDAWNLLAFEVVVSNEVFTDLMKSNWNIYYVNISPTIRIWSWLSV